MSEGKIGKLVEYLFYKNDKRTIPIKKLLKDKLKIHKLVKLKTFQFKGTRVRGKIIMDYVGYGKDGTLYLIDIKAKPKIHDEDKAKLKKDSFIVETITGRKVIPIFLVVTNVRTSDEVKNKKELHGFIKVIGLPKIDF